jgi:hypothetical protein
MANKYYREPFFTMENGRVIEQGEIIKISGEHGSKFKFLEFVRNTENGAEWIDCFELRQGVLSGWRSFRCDRIKPLPKKRGRRSVKES